MRSSGGFLAAGESFLSRLASDELIVKQIGASHIHLSSELERVLKESQKERAKFGAGPDVPISFDFTYQPHRDESSSNQLMFKSQRLSVSRRSFMGSQWSFFRNLNSKTPSEEDTLSWNVDHELWNESFPHIVIKIAGGVGTGICHYIAKYGFYEGGKSNPYRVDPAVLHWVMTGAATLNAVTYVLEFCKASKEAGQQELQELLSEIQISDGALDAGTQHVKEELQRKYREQSEQFEAIENFVQPLLLTLVEKG